MVQPVGGMSVTDQLRVVVWPLRIREGEAVRVTGPASEQAPPVTVTNGHVAGSAAPVAVSVIPYGPPAALVVVAAVAPVPKAPV